MNEGMKFSLLYLDRSKSLKDSNRFRNRLAAYYQQSISDQYRDKIKKSIKLEIGAETPYKFFSDFLGNPS